MNFSTILLAGGKSARMALSTPKPFLSLHGKPMALHSLELFMPLCQEIIVVAPKEYHHLFPASCLFALPGPRRQDSVQNALAYVTNEVVCIHDAARPFLTRQDLVSLLEKAQSHDAVALAAPITSTIKMASPDKTVIQTLPREHLFEIQTPQCIKTHLLKKAFDTIGSRTVTDDLSLMEHLGIAQTLVMGSSTNKKITYKSDLYAQD